MSIEIIVGGENVTLEFIESRPDAGLIFRVSSDPSDEALEELAAGLSAALRDAPHSLFRDCCDSYPGFRVDHAEGCEKAAKQGGKR